jgi:hypothetical protein
LLREGKWNIGIEWMTIITKRTVERRELISVLEKHGETTKSINGYEATSRMAFEAGS